ncbi:MAG: hypothetical protein JW843_08425 [Candidatus Aminicenantes bacterium]|nr:hypothetical protein [Candidatus Aminicenantes bacterium]
MSVEDCPVCGRLNDIETSFSKYGAPEYDRPLPENAAGLVILNDPDLSGTDRHHIRRCPACGALYEYLQSHEYLINGSEEEETLTRLPSGRAASLFLEEARRLEALRRQIDDLRSAAGRLADFLDRGRPSPEEARESLEEMERHHREADGLCRRLQGRGDVLRRAAPEILAVWAGAHMRVCRGFLETLSDSSEDGRTARFVAKSLCEAWDRLPQTGDAFLSVDSPWLPGYLDRLDKEFG